MKTFWRYMRDEFLESIPVLFGFALAVLFITLNGDLDWWDLLYVVAVFSLFDAARYGADRLWDKWYDRKRDKREKSLVD